MLVLDAPALPPRRQFEATVVGTVLSMRRLRSGLALAFPWLLCLRSTLALKLADEQLRALQVLLRLPAVVVCLVIAQPFTEEVAHPTHRLHRQYALHMIWFVICCIVGAAAGAGLCGRLLCGRLLCSRLHFLFDSVGVRQATSAILVVLYHDFSYPVGGPSLTLLWRII
eukprot:scaffold78413_cov67-Phaeocystis_antarctica.AAC.3